MDILTLAIFVIVLALEFAGYALYGLALDYCEGIRADTDARLTRIVYRTGGNAFTVNRVGDN